jgi:hypothetical protein
VAHLPVKYPQWRSWASNGVHCQRLDTQYRGARFGQPAAGYYGTDASMSDTDPDLTAWGSVKVPNPACFRPNSMLGWWFRKASPFSPRVIYAVPFCLFRIVKRLWGAGRQGAGGGLGTGSESPSMTLKRGDWPAKTAFGRNWHDVQSAINRHAKIGIWRTCWTKPAVSACFRGGETTQRVILPTPRKHGTRRAPRV